MSPVSAAVHRSPDFASSGGSQPLECRAEQAGCHLFVVDRLEVPNLSHDLPAGIRQTRVQQRDDPTGQTAAGFAAE